MQDQLTLAELDDQSVELLPDRETLYFDTVGVWASNSSMAFNAATFNSMAASWAGQIITVNG
jgi:hypothetical protein